MKKFSLGLKGRHGNLGWGGYGCRTGELKEIVSAKVLDGSCLTTGHSTLYSPFPSPFLPIPIQRWKRRKEMMWKRETTLLAQVLRTIVSLRVLFSSLQTRTYLHCKPPWTGTWTGEFYLSHELVITKSHFLITNVRSKKMSSTCVLVLNFTLKDAAEPFLVFPDVSVVLGSNHRVKDHHPCALFRE